MADYDASNPYVREAVAAGVAEPWIADFIRRNPDDYHRIMVAASGDAAAFGGRSGSSSLVLTNLPARYQQEVRPWVPSSVPGAPLTAGLLGSGSPLMLVAVAIGAWWIYKRL